MIVYRDNQRSNYDMTFGANMNSGKAVISDSE